MEKVRLFLDLGEVGKDAVIHSSPKGTKVRKTELVLQEQQPRVDFSTPGPNPKFPKA